MQGEICRNIFEYDFNVLDEAKRDCVHTWNACSSTFLCWHNLKRRKSVDFLLFATRNPRVRENTLKIFLSPN